MKTKELELIKDINNKHDSNLKPTKNDYQIFDAYTDKSIIEIKIRDVVYDTHYIQVDMYDLKELKEEIITSEIVPKFAPYRTEFNNNKKITKYFYELHKYNSLNL